MAEDYEHIEHPAHYQSDKGIEVIDVIHAFGLGFNDGNVVKYVLRCGRKPGEEALRDLKKARWYLDDHIKRIESTSNTNS